MFLLLTFCIALFESVASLNQSSFPTDFVFGTASSAYQVLFIMLLPSYQRNHPLTYIIDVTLTLTRD
jgi:hypothetical protein